MILTEYLKTN